MQIPRVSVVIPAYNAALLIERCVQTVLAQTGEFHIEVIVVDDGSSDKTLPLVRTMGDDRINVISQDNHGPAAARNVGLVKATGNYIAFLDADDYWMPGFLQRTVGFLDTQDEAIAVSVGQIHKFPGKPPTIVPQFLQDGSLLCEPEVLDSFFDFWAEHNHVCTGAVLMRTDVARQTGGQRTEFRICEDLEFWAYLATFGKWGFIPEVLFVSDAGPGIKEQGWLRRNGPRWASAPSVEQWQSRVVSHLAPRDMAGFQLARARVAKNLAYSLILSRRDKMAKEAVAYLEGATTDRVGSMLKRASQHGSLVWSTTCSTLRFREFVRDKRLRLKNLWRRH